VRVTEDIILLQDFIKGKKALVVTEDYQQEAWARGEHFRILEIQRPIGRIFF
jgi:hypothetical protein